MFVVLSPKRKHRPKDDTNLSSAVKSDTRGCAFHMHVPFWECLRDSFIWNHHDKGKAFNAEVLKPHLSACPYLNFTFCVKFSQRNDFNMYLPAEIRATNLCACDLDMRLDFSHLINQWTFSCPHYHQQGVSKKCVRRVLVQESRYTLMESSPNLHGGAPSAVNAQTVSSYDKKSGKETSPVPIVHLPLIHITPTPAEQVEEEEDLFKALYRTATVNSAGSKAWLGETATEETVVEWEFQRQEADHLRLILVDKVRDQYLILEKMLDEALCQKIKDEEQRKREETKARLKANVVTCVGCTESPAMCVFIPCFHMVMCEKCGDKSISSRLILPANLSVKFCPSCRRDIMVNDLINASLIIRNVVASTLLDIGSIFC